MGGTACAHAWCKDVFALHCNPVAETTKRPEEGVRPIETFAQEKAGVRVRRFDDLRHTYGRLAIQQFDLVAVKNMMR